MPLNESTVSQAIEEARRFLLKAELALAIGKPEFWPNKENAAMKRASMDLTRALADLRR